MNPATSQQALQNLQQAQSGVTDPNQILTQREQSLGVPGAQQQVTGLRRAITDTTNLLDRVAPGVQGRTANSLVTNAQANRIIQNEQAPIATNLNRQTQDYSSAQSDFDRLLAQAQQQAQLQAQAEQQKVTNAQGIYSALYQREQDAAARAFQEKQLAAQQAAARAAAGGGISLGGFGGSVAPSTGVLNVPLRVPGNPSQGFAFKDVQNNPINALQYSQAAQIPFRDLLAKMAAAGDTGAKSGLSFIGNNGLADPTKVTSQALANLYNSLTGRKVAVYRAPATTSVKTLATQALSPTYNRSPFGL